jgi:hypothetical protein
LFSAISTSVQPHNADNADMLPHPLVFNIAGQNMIGILIISHGNLGDSLIRCANHVMGRKSPYLRHLSIPIRDDPDIVMLRALELVKELDQGTMVGDAHHLPIAAGNLKAIGAPARIGTQGSDLAFVRQRSLLPVCRVSSRPFWRMMR